MKKHFFRLTIIAVVLLSTACVSSKLTTDTCGNIEASHATVARNFEKAVPSGSKHAYEKSQEVDAPWIVGKAVPLARSVTLPQALQKDTQTSMMFRNTWVSLSSAAEQIMLAMNKVVTIAPDVHLDGAALQRKSMKEGGGGGQAAQQSLVAMPAGMPSGANPMPLPLPCAYAVRLPSAGCDRQRWQ